MVRENGQENGQRFFVGVDFHLPNQNGGRQKNH